jgi:hypothetical protein
MKMHHANCKCICIGRKGWLAAPRDLLVIYCASDDAREAMQRLPLPPQIWQIVMINVWLTLVHLPAGIFVLIPVQNTAAEYSAKYKPAIISAIFCTGISTYILATCIRHSCTVYTRAKCTVQVYIELERIFDTSCWPHLPEVQYVSHEV